MKRKRTAHAENKQNWIRWQRTFFAATPKEAAKRTKRLVEEALRRANFD